MGVVVGKTGCPKCIENGRDNSRDNLAVYADGTVHCFSCGYHPHTKLDIDSVDFTVGMKPREDVNIHQVWNEIKLESSDSGDIGREGKGFRGIRNDVSKLFGVRYEYGHSFNVTAQYYPIQTDSKLSGVKVRIIPKTFYTVAGTTGKQADLFGQFKFKNTNAKWVVICAGEVDMMSAYQMLLDDNKSKGGGFEPTACVSPTIGEGGCVDQIKKHYAFFNKFDRIIICFDNDKAGNEATEKVMAVLPKGKVYVASLPVKDTNEMLTKGMEKEFVKCIYQAKKPTPIGITASSKLFDFMVEQLQQPLITLPPYMHRLQDMLAGGIPLGAIVNIASASGTGKTTHANELLYHWIFNSPYKMGILSLELSKGKYAEVLASRHLKRKIALVGSGQEKVDFVNKHRKEIDNLFASEDGHDRFYVLDELGGNFETIKNKVEELIISCDCKLIVLDPLQDILDGMSDEEQAVFMKWEKDWKLKGITFINICHIRKSQGSDKSNSQGRMLSEEDIHGSSTIFKSGNINIMMMRNKTAENDIDKNTTLAVLTKNRDVGITGVCGEYYYHNDTHTIHDKKDFFEAQMEIPNNVVALPVVEAVVEKVVLSDVSDEAWNEFFNTEAVSEIVIKDTELDSVNIIENVLTEDNKYVKLAKEIGIACNLIGKNEELNKLYPDLPKDSKGLLDIDFIAQGDAGESNPMLIKPMPSLDDKVWDSWDEIWMPIRDAYLLKYPKEHCGMVWRKNTA